LTSKFNLSIVLFKEGRLGEAEKLQRGALETEIRIQGAEHPGSLEMQTDLAQTLNAEGHYSAAEKLARATYEAELRIHGPQHPHTLNALRELGKSLAYTHRYSEASKLFRDAIEKQDYSESQGNRWSAWYSFACVAAAGDRPDEALQYLQEAVNRGFKDADGLNDDDDLKNMRTNAKFQELVAKLKRLPPS
jgi:tetratricopeptide (TPR) repeat protein